MTTSGTTSFNLVANQIADEAFDICGIGSEGEAVNADMYERAKRSLNLIVKTWSADPRLWLKTAKSVALIAGAATYVLTPKPLRVLEVRRRTSGIDVPLSEFSRQDYLETPNKTAQSIPISFYYDPQTTTGTLYVWPTASTATAASTTLELTYARTMEDFVNSADDADLPQEWLEALSYALAFPLMIKYKPTDTVRLQAIKGEADRLRAQLESWDVEPASLFMQPDHRWQ